MPALTTRQQAVTFRLINETMRDRLVPQRDAIDRIETKGTVLLGFSIAAAQLYVTQSVSISELRLAGARTIAFEANVPLAKRKERFYWLMLAALLAAALLSILSFTL